MRILVTGAAGFIGYHCSRALLARGDDVIGVDNLDPDCPIHVKIDRLVELQKHKRFRYRGIDVTDPDGLSAGLPDEPIERVVHLAGQPSVRRSVAHPQAHIKANLVGHANVLEYVRQRGDIDHLVYASASSVYGEHTQLPFNENARVDRPTSLYGATKAANELLSHSYAHLFAIPITGLRLFSAYGPWGRPDMAVWSFTEAIIRGKPIELYDAGNMRRDFTYIDDIVAGILAVLDHPPAPGAERHRVYNVGYGRAERVSRLIEVLETTIGRKAITVPAPMQVGELAETAADISSIAGEFGFVPRIPIEVGVPRFVNWYRSRYGEGYRSGRAAPAEAKTVDR